MGKQMHIKAQSAEERFKHYTVKTKSCWLWIGSLHGKGYGHIRLGRGRRMIVSRYSYELHRGPIPNGMIVCHKCDNSRCVNPRHLYLGTYFDNAQDMYVRGRRIGRFSVKDALEMQNLANAGLTHREIATRFKTPRPYVTKIINGKALLYKSI